MASIGHFAQSYITNLYDKQQKKKKKKKKLPADWGGGGARAPPRAPRSYATAWKETMQLVSGRVEFNACCSWADKKTKQNKRKVLSVGMLHLSADEQKREFWF